MRYLLFCTLIFLWINSTAQTNEEQDKGIANLYADTTKIIHHNNLINTLDSNANFYIIKVEDGHVSAFKKQFKTQIKRQLNGSWFIIKCDENSIQQNRFIVKYFLANNLWKLSPALLHNKSKLSSYNDLVFLVETNNNTAFLNFIHQHEAEANILAMHERKLFRVKTSFSFAIKKMIHEDEVISVDVKLNLPKEESVVNDYDNSVNDINLFFAKYPTVDGNGLTVSVKENLF